MRNSNFHIPDELLIQILSILPFKSLGRLRFVSKHWKLLITDTIAAKNPNPKILVFSQLDHRSFHLVDLETRIQSVYLPVEERALKGHYLKAHSSCNGLVLIQIDNNLILWNSLTTFFQDVLTCESYCVADLCFDSVSNEYKVVSGYDSAVCYMAACWATSWEKIVEHDRIHSFHPGPFFKGYRHWFEERGYYDFYAFQSGIFYFNPQKKLFITVPMPNSGIGNAETVVGLGSLDGCLCMARSQHEQTNIEFLSMKEYGNGDSWEIIFNISNVPDRFRYNHIIIDPLFKRKAGKVLLNYAGSGTYDCSLKSYDVNTGLLRNIVFGVKVILYEETWYQPTSPYLESCDYLLNADYCKEDIIGYDSEDFDEYSNVAISVIENSLRKEFRARRKKIDKKKENKCHHIKIAAQLSRKTGGKKRRKGNRGIDASECECCAHTQ